MYPCQLVFDMNEAAVLKDEWVETAPKPCGLSGNQPCSRCNAYRTSIDTALNASKRSRCTPSTAFHARDRHGTA